MGEVYKARDTRLNRSVAIKIVSQLIAAAPEVRVRLEREARAISQLNHPHICTLYDIGTQAGIDYLVLEYLEGQTLADRLLAGPLSVEETVRIATQICDALDRAHRAGFVHRDLKPANVMLTKSGAKLLDFGIAKHAALPLAGGSTASAPLTSEGTLIGTLHYMSPEQVEGRAADARSDIFSLGAMLYEMIAGTRAFGGQSAAAIMTAILRDTPAPVGRALAGVPAALDRLIRRCLEKDPDERWQSARDVLLMLREIASGSDDATMSVATRQKRWPLAALTAVAVAGLGLGAWESYIARSRAENVPLQLEIALSDGLRFYRNTPEVALAPDGRRVAATLVDAAGVQQIFVRAIAETAWQPLPGSDGGVQPFWSFDGQRVGFFARGRLKHVGLDGGPIQDVAAVTDPRGGAWLADNSIVFTASSNSGVLRVRASGGEPQQVTRPAPGETHRFPSALPDVRRFLLWIGGAQGENVHVASVEGGVTRRLVASDARAVYGAGLLLYVRSGTLVAQSFALDAERLTGEPITIAPNVDYGGPPGSAAVDIAPTGVVIYSTGAHMMPRAIVWRKRDGIEVSRLRDIQRYSGIVLAPDDRRLAVSISDRMQAPSIWIVDSVRNVSTRLTEAVAAWFPLWTRDGSRVVFHVEPEAVTRSADAGQRGAAVPVFPTSMAPDGTVLGHDTNDQSGWDVYAVRDGKAERLISTPFAEAFPSISPDGRWLAWMSDESGQFEVYLAHYPDLQGKERVSVNGGGQPRWRADGKELFFIGSGKLMAVGFDTRAGVHLGTPRPLFNVDISPAAVPYMPMYAPAADGQRFVLLESAPGAALGTLRLLNRDWLRARGIKGGHTFGVRRTDPPISAWSQPAESWVRAIGMIAR